MPAPQNDSSPIGKAAASTNAAREQAEQERKQRQAAEKRCHDKEEELLVAVSLLLESTDSADKREELLDELLLAIQQRQSGETLRGQGFVEEALRRNSNAKSADEINLATLAEGLNQRRGYRLSRGSSGRLNLQDLDDNGQPVRRQRTTQTSGDQSQAGGGTPSGPPSDSQEQQSSQPDQSDQQAGDQPPQSDQDGGPTGTAVMPAQTGEQHARRGRR